ncbi:MULTISPECIES: SDR family oxidoreductase [Caldilinea]|jgi:3-oxoacyl-[acyl-carrier protein] reductase|uniref:Putative oxidoreductase n=1 Tax=Caldilinea aerophila (strain DSM 14535 / JCM 11387 / NBRC 104270 / STL-6-O1) TaxID=926550 RepID=I0HYW9_CALAS|nr:MULTISPECIES: SDR family oxidoreductase [Caldilinea]BAL98206.1 putative oxidoreductase [Caldilinea aerophila DSM 14535 = NBRC 104270]GIV75522.1 MAG: 3-ketoacyl-ACP reductase [Caldilinea sp.]
MKIDLSGRIAIVTGASRRAGIGAAIARRLAGAGADLLITYFLPYDRRTYGEQGEGEVEQLLSELRAFGVRAYGLEANLSQSGTPRHIFDTAHGLLGMPSILVNNACHSEPGGIEQLDADQLDRHYAVNVRGSLLMCQEFLRRWRGTHGGRIISLTSGQGVGPMPGELAYVVTKAAIDAMTITLAAEVAGRGITVNAVDPGPTDTGWMSAELREAIAAKSYLRRVGLPEDVANLVCFLASDQGEWITGQIIRSRGGT